MRVCLYVPCGHLLGKGWPLGSRLWCRTVICHFPIGILGQVWYLIVSILIFAPLLTWTTWGLWAQMAKLACLAHLLAVCHKPMFPICFKYDMYRITILYMIKVYQAFWESLCLTVIIILASAWDFQQCGMCHQQSLRSDCAYEQSDQSLC